METVLVDENRCKIQASVKKQLINRFRDVIVEGEVHRMAYFGVVPNQSGYRATEHEFKLAFLHRTTVIGVNDNIIPRTCFSVYPFTELLKITDDHPYFVDVIGLLTSVGEEKEYAREGKIVKMIVVELASKDLTMRRTLFGEYVDQMNHFLGSGYVEQPVVILQLAKIKVFRGQVGLQNVMHATKILFNPDIHEVLEFKKSMIEQGIHGTQPLFIANESKIVSLEDDFMRLTRICTIEDLQDNNEVYIGFRIKIAIEDETAHGIFVLFDREASYLIKSDTYPIGFRELIGKKVLLKIDTKPVGVDKYFGTFRVKRVCDDAAIIVMFELPNYDANDEISLKKEDELIKPVIVGKDSAHVKEESPIMFEKKLQTCGQCSNTKNGSPLLIDSIGEKEDEVIGLDDICADVDIVKAKPILKLRMGLKYKKETILRDCKANKNLNPEFEKILAKEGVAAFNGSNNDGV
ncbi:uncharacterized protein LOC110271971 [Arachis ipaensis]|uniref:uncharacterized protein LOC110271971 n=1 Tax=Arachis ipaensis TaxID=130454 RepID=UPI000A2B249D|nr:uncharacterized protein LOC110271971 [Arachis ipaensis]